jgi:hypothetical protein
MSLEEFGKGHGGAGGTPVVGGEDDFTKYPENADPEGRPVRMGGDGHREVQTAQGEWLKSEAKLGRDHLLLNGWNRKIENISPEDMETVRAQTRQRSVDQERLRRTVGNPNKAGLSAKTTATAKKPTTTTPIADKVIEAATTSGKATMPERDIVARVQQQANELRTHHAIVSGALPAGLPEDHPAKQNLASADVALRATHILLQAHKDHQRAGNRQERVDALNGAAAGVGVALQHLTHSSILESADTPTPKLSTDDVATTFAHAKSHHIASGGGFRRTSTPNRTIGGVTLYGQDPGYQQALERIKAEQGTSAAVGIDPASIRGLTTEAKRFTVGELTKMGRESLQGKLKPEEFAATGAKDHVDEGRKVADQINAERMAGHKEELSHTIFGTRTGINIGTAQTTTPEGFDSMADALRPSKPSKEAKQAVEDAKTEAESRRANEGSQREAARADMNTSREEESPLRQLSPTDREQSLEDMENRLKEAEPKPKAKGKGKSRKSANKQMKGDVVLGETIKNIRGQTRGKS